MLTLEQLELILDLCEEAQRHREQAANDGAHESMTAYYQGLTAIAAVQASIDTLRGIANL